MEEHVMSSKRESIGSLFRELYHHRSLLYALSIRDLKVTYSRTLLGIFWSIMQPLVVLTIYMIIVNRLFDVYSEEVPYALYTFAGLTGWYMFTRIVNNTGMALIDNSDLVKKIAFPKLILPLSRVFTVFVEFLVSLAVLGVIMIVYGIAPGWSLLGFPVFVVLNILIGLTLGIWLSALSIRFRDLHHIIPSLLNLFIWLTPVFYPVSIIPKAYQPLMYLNPMAGVLEGYRWTVLGGHAISPVYCLAFGLTLLLLVLGVVYFRLVEDRIVDWV